MRTFVIGDCHGSVDRLVALLDRAEIRPDHPGIEIVQLGDLGDYRRETAVNDERAWEIAHKYNFHVLWGNHDWALIDPQNHSFRGQSFPTPRTLDFIQGMGPDFALARNGFLLTHAGLHPRYVAPGELGANPAVLLASWVSTALQTPSRWVINDIGPHRGGSADQGGILWRDAREPLLDIPQIFGHSSAGMIRRYNGHSYCIDVGSKKNGNLAGIWLDTMQIVAVGPDAEQHENYPPYEGELV